jgi:pimeloyl-ACP methyl ester carboxylesterase
MNAPLPPLAAAAARSAFITSRDGLKLHARIYGPEASARLPVLCLPGLARTHQDFHELALALAHDAQAPRRVVCVDYRGRGLSDYDSDWKRYDIRVELDDVAQQMAGLGLEHAVFVGTSRGGLITMAMGAMRPGAIKGVVINDIGPVIEAAGLIRIRSYVGKLPQPRDFAAAADILKRFFGSQFTAFGPADWETMARRTWKETPQGLAPDYDPALMKMLDQLDLEAPLPILWPYFDALKHAPMLAIRGENSDIISAATHAEMGRRHPDCALHVAQGQGHAPVLGTPDVVAKVKRLIARVERS